jgi:7-cyano-7-deazaguanine synthase
VGKNNMKKIVMALSGGMDSTTMLAHYLYNDYEVETLTFTYGSKHNQYENKAAEDICKYYGLKYNLCDLSNIIGTFFKSDLLKSGGDIPEGHYTDASMSRTVVPGRNIIFLSILSGYAWSVNANKIAIGIHQGDHAIYEDCRKEFYKAMDTAIYLGTGSRVEIDAPFVGTDKTGICKIGLDLKVPYELTRTCYKDQPISCGKCGSCVERLEAFSLNNSKDPIKYVWFPS